MSSAYVCQTCRRELRRQIARPRTGQWFPRASFISFNEIVPPKKEKEAKTVPHTPARVDNGDGRYSKFGSSQQMPAASDAAHIQNLRSLQASQRGNFDQLFPTTPANEAQSPKPVSNGTSSIQDTPVHKIHAILSTQGHDPAEAWAIFAQAYSPVDKPRWLNLSSEERDLIKEKNVWNRLLHSICFKWSPEDSSHISPAAVIDHYEKLGIMRGSWYLTEILAVIYRMIRFDIETPREEKVNVRYELESQTLLLWSHFLRNCSNSSWTKRLANDTTIPEVAINWTGTPDPEPLFFGRNMGKDAYNFQFRLHALFRSVPYASRDHLAAAATLTFDYFSTRYCQPYSIRDERVVYEPFLKLVIKLLHGAKNFQDAIQMSRNLLQDNNVSAEEIEKLANRMQQTQYRAALAMAIDSLDILGGETINLSPEQEQHLGAYFTTRIKRQVEKENRNVMDQLWGQAILTYSSPETTDGRKSSSVMPARIYSAFLFGYRELKEPEKQADVWNHMIASKITPSPDQWGLMISARSRNLSSMEHLWERMISSGTKPTHQTWCTRIGAFIYNGNPEEGIQMIYQWGNLWMSEVRAIFKGQNVDMPDIYRLTRDGPTVPRPNADTLTTVITALVQRKKGRRLDLVPDAFAWAHQFGIKPNVWAYNILFRTCLLDGNLKEAMQILSKMEDDKVQPDAYTFYGFADYVFKSGSENGLGETDQYNLIFSILDMLEQRGLDPNAVFFGTMIDGLLRRHNNVQAALMLLRIMMDKNMTIPPPIWTSLITHYFSRVPPHMNSIDALWRRMQSYERLSLDAIFYDRIIEGYAQHGDVTRAATFLDRMSKEGKRPGWPALTAMLMAYLQVGMVDLAKGLVDDVVSGAGAVRAGIRAPRGVRHNPDREKFFNRANAAGLVREGGVDMDEIGRREAAMEGLGVEGITAVEGIPLDMPAAKSAEQIEATFASPGLDLSGGWEEHVESVR